MCKHAICPFKLCDQRSCFSICYFFRCVLKTQRSLNVLIFTHGYVLMLLTEKDD